MSKSHKHMSMKLISFSLALAYGAGAAAASTFVASPSVSGNLSNLALSANIQVATPDVSQVESVYLAAQLGKLWFFNNGSYWSAPQGNAYPAFSTGALPMAQSVPIVNNMDMRGLGGTKVFVGYGRDANDMLTRGNYQKIYTVPPVPAASAKKVIIFVWDGLRPDSINATDTPNLYQMAQSGVNFSDNHSTYPTFTMMNAASFATGSFPGTTGFYGNTLWQTGPTGNDSSAKPVDFT